jgi:hypothetical protein
MMTKLADIILLLGVASLADAHGFLKNIQVNSKTYPAWQVGQDDFVKPPPVRYARKLKDNGSVPDFTSKDITQVSSHPHPGLANSPRCGAGGNIPAEGVIELKAGDKVYSPHSPLLHRLTLPVQ